MKPKILLAAAFAIVAPIMAQQPAKPAPPSSPSGVSPSVRLLWQVDNPLLSSGGEKLTGICLNASGPGGIVCWGVTKSSDGKDTPFIALVAPGTGKLLWRRSGIEPQNGMDTTILSAVATANGAVVVGSVSTDESSKGFYRISFLDGKSGKTTKEVRLAFGTLAVDGKGSSSGEPPVILMKNLGGDGNLWGTAEGLLKIDSGKGSASVAAKFPAGSIAYSWAEIKDHFYCALISSQKSELKRISTTGEITSVALTSGKNIQNVFALGNDRLLLFSKRDDGNKEPARLLCLDDKAASIVWETAVGKANGVNQVLFNLVAMVTFRPSEDISDAHIRAFDLQSGALLATWSNSPGKYDQVSKKMIANWLNPSKSGRMTGDVLNMERLGPAIIQKSAKGATTSLILRELNREFTEDGLGWSFPIAEGYDRVFTVAPMTGGGAVIAIGNTKTSEFRMVMCLPPKKP